jgi:hypothetical protein
LYLSFSCPGYEKNSLTSLCFFPATIYLRGGGRWRVEKAGREERRRRGEGEGREETGKCRRRGGRGREPKPCIFFTGSFTEF